LLLEVEPRVHILEVLVDLATLSVLGLFALLLEVFQVAQSGLIGAVFEVEAELIEAAVLGPVDLTEDELTETIHLLFDGSVDPQQTVL
jgi:hypothetical protein